MILHLRVWARFLRDLWAIRHFRDGVTMGLLVLAALVLLVSMARQVWL